MKLIPLSEYVELQLNTKQSTSEFKEAVKNYTKFLRQPLTLSMFVLADERDNPLDEGDLSPEELDTYRSKILFEGWKLDHGQKHIWFKDGCDLWSIEFNRGFQLQYNNAFEDFLTFTYPEVIEDLFITDKDWKETKIKLTLTPSSLQKIGREITK